MLPTTTFPESARWARAGAPSPERPRQAAKAQKQFPASRPGAAGAGSAPAPQMRKARGSSPAKKPAAPSVAWMWRAVLSTLRYCGATAASGNACTRTPGQGAGQAGLGSRAEACPRALMLALSRRQEPGGTGHWGPCPHSASPRLLPPTHPQTHSHTHQPKRQPQKGRQPHPPACGS